MTRLERPTNHSTGRPSVTPMERPTNHTPEAGQAGGGVAVGFALSPVLSRCAVPGMATRISLREAPNLKSLPSKLLEYTVSAKPRGEAQGDLVAAPGSHPPPPSQWRTPRETGAGLFARSFGLEVSYPATRDVPQPLKCPVAKPEVSELGAQARPELGGRSLWLGRCEPRGVLSQS